MRYATTQPYLTGGFAYTFRDHRRVSGNGVGAYLGGGIALDQYWGYEADILYNSFSAHEPNGARWDSWGGRFNGLFFINRDPNFEPFLQAGVGAVRNHSLIAPADRRSSRHCRLRCHELLPAVWTSSGCARRCAVPV